MRLISSLHLTRFFFLVMGIGVALVGAAHFLPWIGFVGKTVLIVAEGDFDGIDKLEKELLAQNGFYAELYNSQFQRSA
jgi:hypothetical protein